MDTPGLGLSLLGLLGVVALVATNAFFVAIEFALVAVRRTQVEVWVAEGRRGRAVAKKPFAVAGTVRSDSIRRPEQWRKESRTWHLCETIASQLCIGYAVLASEKSL